jgi:hypothetical protein
MSTKKWKKLRRGFLTREIELGIMERNQTDERRRI